MSKKGQFQYETVSEFLHGKLCRREAAELLSMTERSIARIARRIETKGLMGVVHGNRGRSPINKHPDALKNSVVELVQKLYYDFNMTHALEMLEREHGLKIPYESFRRWCHEKGMVKRAKRRRPQARYRRVRMPNEGLLLQMDGSPYRYNGKDEWCLIAAIDDATSDIPYAEFFHTEDTLNCMTVLQKIIESKGIPHALYVDQAGCLGGLKRQGFNQFLRACDQLGIRIIKASCPEAKGRIERAWDTFQDRLVPEMRLRNVHTMPAANDYLQAQFLPNYWRKELTVVPRSPESRYRPLSPQHELRQIFCLKEFRSVNRDHTVSWESQTYSLESPRKYSIWKQKIEIRTYQDLTWQAFYANEPIDLKPVSLPRRSQIAA